MPTVTPPPTTSSPSPVTPAGAVPSVTPVQAGVGNAPDKIQQLAQQIQVSGVITQPPDGGEVTLSTVLGNLTILLPQLAKDQQDKLMQQLLALFQSQKPLTVVVQPGDPPTQALLLLPPAPSQTGTAAAQNAAAQTNILTQAITPLQSLPPLAPGTILPSVVLPANTVTASNVLLPTPLPGQQAPVIPAPVAGAAFPPLTAIPTDEHIAILTDMLLLEELAVKAQALAEEVIPQLQARIFGDMPLPQTPGASVPQTPGQPIAAPVATPGTVAVPPLPPGTNPVSSPVSVTLQPVSLAPQAILSAALQSLASTQQSISLPPQAAALLPLSVLLQPGTEVNLRVDAVALPGAPALPLPSQPNQILATVTGSGPNGQLLVQAGDATLYVKPGVNVPVGSTLLVTVEPGRGPALTPLPLPDIGTFAPLQQALAVLAQADPQLARQVMENAVPQPTAALGGALLFFLSAFKQGDLRGWLGGNAIDLLTKAGKMELIARLTQQLTQGGEAVHDPVVGAWRSYNVPIYTNNQFQTLHLYVHGDGQGGGKGDASSKPGGNAVRFLIDMRLSKLGAIQLDGFVRQKKLDMIVRSEQVLPTGLNDDLRQSYIKALDAVGYAGSLNFQLGRQHWLSLRKPGAGSVVT